MTIETNKTIGYIRVSAVDQNLSRQKEALAPYNCDKIFEEKKSGKNITDRPVFQEAINMLRKGDTFIVKSLDRLGRNQLDLLNTITKLDNEGVTIKVIDNGFVFDGSPMAKLIISMMGALHEFNRSLIIESQREGLSIAKRKWQDDPTLPRPGKRKNKALEDKIIKYIKMKENGELNVSNPELAKLIGCSLRQIYKVKKNIDNNISESL